MASHLQVKSLLERQRIQSLLSANQHSFIQMTNEEFFDYVICIKRTEGMNKIQAITWIDNTLAKHHVVSKKWNDNKEKIKTLSGLIPIALDFHALNALAEEIKLSGKAFAKYRQVMYNGGKRLIIINNYINSRKHLTSSRYISNKPKVISLATGARTAKNAIKSGFALTIIVSGAYHCIDQIMNDELTWHYFVGGMAVDISIALATTGIAFALSSSVLAGTVIMAATGPLILVIAISLILAFTINLLFDSEEATKRLASLLSIAEKRLPICLSGIHREILTTDKNLNGNIEEFIRSFSGIPNIQHQF